MRYEIVGARGAVPDPKEVVDRAQAWAAERGGGVLLADASAVFGRDHLESAVLHAVRAHASGGNVARSIGLEALRYLAARRQVADAIQAAGLKAGTDRIAVVAFDAPADELVRRLGWTRDDTVLDSGQKSLRPLGITEEQTATVPPGKVADLALERVALVDLEK